VHLLDQVHRAQRVGLARAGRAAALVDPAHRTLQAQDRGAAGERGFILRVPDQDAGDVGDGSF
jgi:hypothetical protein